MQDDYSLDTAERRAVLRALLASGWNKRESARMLGISKTTLYRKMARYDLDEPPSGVPIYRCWGPSASFRGQAWATPASRCA